jgi:hypothetical protein
MAGRRRQDDWGSLESNLIQKERRRYEDKPQMRSMADAYAYPSPDNGLSPLAVQEKERSAVVERWAGREEGILHRFAERDLQDGQTRQHMTEMNAQILRAQIAEKERARQQELRASRVQANEVRRDAQAFKMNEEQAAIERRARQAEYLQTLSSQVSNRGALRNSSVGTTSSAIRDSAARIVGSSVGKTEGNKENSFNANMLAFFGADDSGSSNKAAYGEADYFSKPSGRSSSNHNPIVNPVGGHMPQYDGKPMYRSRGLRR